MEIKGKILLRLNKIIKDPQICPENLKTADANILIFSEDEGDGDVESHKASLYEAGVKILAFLSCPLVLH